MSRDRAQTVYTAFTVLLFLSIFSNVFMGGPLPWVFIGLATPAMIFYRYLRRANRQAERSGN